MQTNPDDFGKVILAIYCVVGLPVVWLHIRQQKMEESIRRIQAPQLTGLVIYTLAVMWPLLLLSMALTHFLRKPPSVKPSDAKTDANTNDPHQGT